MLSTLSTLSTFSQILEPLINALFYSSFFYAIMLVKANLLACKGKFAHGTIKIYFYGISDVQRLLARKSECVHGDIKF